MNMRKIRKQGRTCHFLSSCAAIGILAGSVSAVQAAHIEGKMAVELAGDYGKQGANKTKSVNPTVALAASLFVTPSWSLQGGWTLEPLSEADTSYFRRLGLSTDELYVQYEAGMFRVFGGKVNPTFGTAWDSAPGVYGTGLAEEYELGEGYIAAGAAVTLKAAGEHILTGTVYRTDRSFLSQTAFTASESTTLVGDAAVANTKGFKSFSVTLDSGNVFGVDGLNTHLGYRSQAKGVGIDKDETGFVVGASYDMDLTNAVKMELMGEYADFSNYAGTKDNDARYITLGAGFTYQTYNIALAYTMKEEGTTSANTVDSTLLSASIGAEIWNEWALDVGYALGTKDGAEDTHTIGFTLAKAFEFTNGQ